MHLIDLRRTSLAVLAPLGTSGATMSAGPELNHPALYRKRVFLVSGIDIACRDSNARPQRGQPGAPTMPEPEKAQLRLVPVDKQAASLGV